MLKNYHQMVIKSILKNQLCLKSPFDKGGFKGIFFQVIKTWWNPFSAPDNIFPKASIYHTRPAKVPLYPGRSARVSEKRNFKGILTDPRQK